MNRTYYMLFFLLASSRMAGWYCLSLAANSFVTFILPDQKGFVDGFFISFFYKNLFKLSYLFCYLILQNMKKIFQESLNISIGRRLKENATRKKDVFFFFFSASYLEIGQAHSASSSIMVWFEYWPNFFVEEAGRKIRERYPGINKEIEEEGDR